MHLLLFVFEKKIIRNNTNTLSVNLQNQRKYVNSNGGHFDNDESSNHATMFWETATAMTTICQSICAISSIYESFTAWLKPSMYLVLA